MHFIAAFCLCLVMRPVRKHSIEHVFDLHDSDVVSKSGFHMKGFTPRLVLKLR